ncbi:MAG: DUF1844 domain-containing protein [Candidatus Omnitrophica bacterium]|nr:DUF1844 domain-containing protein [Candidatus Omnitrophota bacterium]
MKESSDLTFINYLTSLGLQAMVFLGEIPSPVSQRLEQNLKQAKLLIDTLVVLQDKTKGNLSYAECHLLDASVEELSGKYNRIAGGME